MDQATLSNLLLTVNTNYGTYYECQAKLDGFIEWYSDNKKVFDGVK